MHVRRVLHINLGLLVLLLLLCSGFGVLGLGGWGVVFRVWCFLIGVSCFWIVWRRAAVIWSALVARLAQTCPNLYRLANTCPDCPRVVVQFAPTLALTCPDLPRLAKACAYLQRLAKTVRIPIALFWSPDCLWRVTGALIWSPGCVWLVTCAWIIDTHLSVACGRRLDVVARFAGGL